MHDTSECTFCHLANGLLPSFVVYETQQVTCFLANEPISEGHTLIVPKKPYLDPDELDTLTAQGIMDASILICRALKELYHLDLGE